MKLKYYFKVFIAFLQGKSVSETQKFIAEIEHKILMMEIRSMFRVFGFDLSCYTDAELEQRITDSAKSLAQAGLSANEASMAFQKLADSMNLVSQK